MKIKINILEKYEFIKKYIRNKNTIIKRTSIYNQLFKKFKISEEKNKSQLQKFNNNPKSKFKSNSVYKTIAFNKSIFLEKFFIILLILNNLLSLSKENHLRKIASSSEITITIRGTGDQSIL